MNIRFTIEGTTPLLMSSQRGANPRDPLAREARLLAQKRSKLTDDEYDKLSDLEYTLRIYHDKALGPFLPAENVKRCIQDGAKMTKAGKQVERALWPIENAFALVYEGPRDLPGLLADPAFRDVRMAGVMGGLIERTRPFFTEWSLTPVMEMDETLLDLDQLADYLVKAGKYSGLGDYRPRFGRFRLDGTIQEVSDDGSD